MRRHTLWFCLVLAVSLLAFPFSGRAQLCGNGILDPGETCDPPGSVPEPDQGLCRANCTFCGDGILDLGELCDLGPVGMCGECLNCTFRILSGGGNGGCPCESNDPDMRALSADVIAACGCDDDVPHPDFMRCARERVAAFADAGRLLPGCVRDALECISRSTCGRPGTVTCCRTSRVGVKRCMVKPSAARCTATRGGSAFVGAAETCCGACP